MRAVRFSVALTFAISAAAVAGPPFLTDDPAPVEKRNWEIYFASSLSRSGGGSSGAGPFFDINYGATDFMHVHMLLQWAFDSPLGGRAQSGFGDVEIGAKIRFVPEGRRSPQIATYPAIDFPTGSAARGLGAGQTRFFLPIWMQKSFGSMTVYGGGGYWRNPGAGNRDYGFFGLTGQYAAGRGWTLGGEVFHVTSMALGEPAHTGFNLGFVYDFNEEWHALLSAGRDFKGGNSLYGYLGLQWTFGPK